MLLSNLNLLATAPGGVARLRELILTLAVQGKLVPQNPDDEAASVLLQKIRAEKDRLIAAGKIKRDKPLAAIAEEEKPFGLPENWEWVRLGSVVNLTYGKNLPTTSLTDEGYQVFGANGVIGKYTEYLYLDKQLLISCRGAYSGKPNISPSKCFVTNNSIVCEFIARSLVDLEFFYRQLQVVDKSRLVTGSAQPQVTIANADPLVLAVPPLAEQTRIVARVEELMRLCDALETKGQLEAAQHAQLVATLLGTLADSQTPDALAENWQRIASHFDFLLDRPQAVDALEQTVLQLAVRGLLVPQDASDEPASALLQKIRAEKDRLIAAGQIKRDKPLPPVAEEEKPFQLPQGWEWVRVSDLCSMVTDGEHLTPQRCDDVTEIPLVTAKNVRREVMDYRVTDFVPKDIAEKCWQRCKPSIGDILMVSVGATLGRLCVLRESVDMVLVRSVTVLRPVHLGVFVDFFALHLMSQDSQSEIWREVKQSAQPCLYLSKSAALKIALPPLAEQARIVARVQALRGLCADLRQRLAASRAAQAQLAEALVSLPNG